MESKELILTGNNVSICYNGSGTSSVPVHFIHGFPFDKKMWHPQFSQIFLPLLLLKRGNL
jgi:hypothetical protein